MAVSKRNKFSVYMLGVCLLLETVAFVCVTVIQVGELAVNFITHLNTAIKAYINDKNHFFEIFFQMYMCNAAITLRTTVGR